MTIDGCFFNNCWYVVRVSLVFYCLILGTGDLITGFFDVYIIIFSRCGLFAVALELLVIPGMFLVLVWKLLTLFCLLSDKVLAWLSIR